LREALRILGECRTPADLRAVPLLEIVRIEENKGKAAIRFSIDGERVFAKIYWSISPLKRLKDGVRGVTLGVKEARNIKRIASCGVDTPELLAYGSSAAWLVPNHSYLILREIGQAETLWAYVNRTADTGIVTDAAELIWRIHHCGLVHRDLHSKNVLLQQDDGARRLVVIDALGVGRVERRAARVAELARFLRKHGRIWLNRESVDRFCQRYYQLGGNPLSKYNNYNEFRNILDRKLSEYKPYRQPGVDQ